MQIQLHPDGRVTWDRYSPDIIPLIKEIPASKRTYDPDTKQWTIDPSEHAAFAARVSQVGHTVGMPASTEPPKAPWLPTPPPSADSALDRRVAALEGVTGGLPSALEEMRQAILLLHGEIKFVSDLLRSTAKNAGGAQDAE